MFHVEIKKYTLQNNKIGQNINFSQKISAYHNYFFVQGAHLVPTGWMEIVRNVPKEGIVTVRLIHVNSFITIIIAGLVQQVLQLQGKVQPPKMIVVSHHKSHKHKLVVVVHLYQKCTVWTAM